MSYFRAKQNTKPVYGFRYFTIVGPNCEKARMPIGDLLNIIEEYGYEYSIKSNEIAIFTENGSIELEIR